VLDNDADQTVDAPTLSSVSRSGKLYFVLVTYFLTTHIVIWLCLRITDTEP
jgi:hypothetical protein